jgi:hypothetical protein
VIAGSARISSAGTQTFRRSIQPSLLRPAWAAGAARPCMRAAGRGPQSGALIWINAPDWFSRPPGERNGGSWAVFRVPERASHRRGAANESAAAPDSPPDVACAAVRPDDTIAQGAGKHGFLFGARRRSNLCQRRHGWLMPRPEWCAGHPRRRFVGATVAWMTGAGLDGRQRRLRRRRTSRNQRVARRGSQRGDDGQQQGGASAARARGVS